MKRRVVAVGAAAVVVGLAVPFAPRLLRRFEFFRVRQVELVGLRYLAPESVLASLRLGAERNLFDPKDEVERRARAIPGVVGARVERRLPGTLRVVFTERAPVAFAPGPAGLVPLDARGRPLAYDPTVTGFDLPVLAAPDSVLTRVLALVRGADSALFHDVQIAEREAHETVRLELRQGVVLLTIDPTADQVRAIETVRQHLRRAGDRFAALDARFAGWIVVRRSPA